MKRTYNDGGEIEAKIKKFTDLLNDPRTTDAGERERLQKGIEKLKSMLPTKEEKKEEKTEKKEPVKKAEKTQKKEEKVEKKADKPKKGIQVLSSKRVVVNGTEMEVDSKEFCDYLLVEFRDRREKAQQKKETKKKTTSVMSKVSQSIERGITTAIKSGIKDNKVAIDKNPKVFIGKVEKLETATKNFLENLKEVLGSEYDAKEVTSTTKAIQEMIDDLKKKYADK
jgi:hypothetical protein